MQNFTDSVYSKDISTLQLNSSVSTTIGNKNLQLGNEKKVDKDTAGRKKYEKKSRWFVKSSI